MVTVLIPVPLSALLMGTLSPALCTQSEAGHPLWGESPTESPLVLPAPPWLSLVQGAATSPDHSELPSQELPLLLTVTTCSACVARLLLWLPLDSLAGGLHRAKGLRLTGQGGVITHM